VASPYHIFANHRHYSAAAHFRADELELAVS
jgi:hypothetical protein